MSERAASELRETKRALTEAQQALRKVRAIAVDGDDGRLADGRERCSAIEEVTRAVAWMPVGELWPGTTFEAGGKEFLLVSNRGDKVFAAKIGGGGFTQGVSFPQSYPVTVIDDSRAAERDFWQRGG